MSILRFLKSRSFEALQPALGFSFACFAFATCAIILHIVFQKPLLTLTFALAAGLAASWTVRELSYLLAQLKEEKDQSS